MKAIADQAAETNSELNRQTQSLVHLAEAAGDILRSFGEMVRPVVSALVLLDAISKASEKSGWLPYGVVPFGRFLRECGGETDAFVAEVSTFYENNWQVIVSDIETQVPAYDLDDEAKEAFLEALTAHGHGLYRCVCRLMAPEIERVIREEWLGITGIKTVNQKLFEQAVNKKFLEDFLVDGPCDWVLFGRLRHMFEWVQDRAQIEGEPIPNRHAVTHGWVAYSSMQDSLNTIICADYIFRLITSFKKMNVGALTDPGDNNS